MELNQIIVRIRQLKSKDILSVSEKLEIQKLQQQLDKKIENNECNFRL